MILIPGGTFEMGSNDEGRDNRPAHSVTLSPYCLARTEVSVAEYAACMEARVCARPRPRELTREMRQDEAFARFEEGFCQPDTPDRRDHPVNCVDWSMARTYCRWIGGRLPTEAEWEFAARGTDGRRYPWGNEPPTVHRVNVSAADSNAEFERVIGEGYGQDPMFRDEPDGFPTTAPVDSFPSGASPFGILHLADNVSEWVEDWFAPYTAEPASNPVQTRPTGRWPTRGVRGDSWDAVQVERMTASIRRMALPDVPSPRTGIRCAASVGGAAR